MNRLKHAVLSAIAVILLFTGCAANPPNATADEKSEKQPAKPTTLSDNPDTKEYVVVEDAPQHMMDRLDSLAVHLDPGSNRPYLFSGTGTSFYYGTTESQASEGWMGLHSGAHKLLDDWLLFVDGEPRDREAAHVVVFPYKAVFRWPDGVELTVAPQGVDRDDLRFTLTNLSPAGSPSSPPAGETGDFSTGIFFVFPAHYDVDVAFPKKGKGIQYFLLNTGKDSLFTAAASPRWFEMREMKTRSDMTTGTVSPHAGKPIHGLMFDEGVFDVTFAWGESAQTAGDRAVEIRETGNAESEARKQWLLNELNRSYFHSSDTRFNKALDWAKIHLAMLYAEDETLLWAGLPWFNEGWARDTFISLPGAALVTGKFDAAKKILRRFAQWQNNDPESPDYGKVPNRARGEDIIYNTADGTPWFIRELYEYGLYSGDHDLWRELWPVVMKSVEGTLLHRVDSLGFVTHGDADTWMDAKGPDGAWSPRGNRAVEIQALWLAQLDAALAMAEYVGHTDVKEWQAAREKLIRNFPEHFVRKDGQGLYDHLDPDRTPDSKIRPNQLWAITASLETPNPLLTSKQQAAIVNTVRDSLVYEWGVASLAQTDEDFHPYHQSSHYPKDAAYHMGIVWTWLSGPYKTASRLGWGIAENEIAQMLDRGVPGALSENLDALPREGNDQPNLSGTVSQTWSSAEFVRTVYQDYLGIRPLYGAAGSSGMGGASAIGLSNAWSFDPRLPESWGNVEAIVWIGDQPVMLTSKIAKDIATFTFEALRPADLGQPLTIHAFTRTLDAPLPSLLPTLRLTAEYPRASFEFPRDGDSVEVRVRAGEMLPAFQTKLVPLFISAADDRPFLGPRVPEGIASLAPPKWLMLAKELVKANNPKARVVIDASDPSGDDTGVVEGQTYGYPTHAMFKDGILDLTHFSLRVDPAMAYFALTFRDLVDPKWHPEYGFQLTFATIAIQTDVEARERTQEVGYNSKYILPEQLSADRLIHVGGGFELVDGNGEILAAHRPDDPQYALGNVNNKTVSFAIPLELIGGIPENWKITVLAGAQDDHGGGGIGEYREVTSDGGEWSGSGGGEDDPNIYDLLFTQ